MKTAPQPLTYDELVALPAGLPLCQLVAQYVLDKQWAVAGRQNRLFSAEELGIRQAADRTLRLGYDPELNEAGAHYVHGAAHYSSDIGLAWKVVEAMRAKGYWLSLNDDTIPEQDNWYAQFAGHGIEKLATAETAPLAICRAALLCLSVKTPITPIA